MTEAFRSERLVYRAIENNDEDIEFLHSLNLQPDRITFEKPLFKPITKKLAQEQANRLEKAFLCVIICLPISPENGEEKGCNATSKVLKPIGRLSLDQVEDCDRHHRNTNIAIFIASEYQRKGYGGEAINWVLGWAFQMAGLHRVGIGCYSYNLGAKKLYERLGFVFEGNERESVWYDGAWYDHITMGMLESEWRNLNKTEQSKSGSATIPITS